MQFGSQVLEPDINRKGGRGNFAPHCAPITQTLWPVTARQSKFKLTAGNAFDFFETHRTYSSLIGVLCCVRTPGPVGVLENKLTLLFHLSSIF